MLFNTIVVSTLLWVTQGTPTGNHTCTGVVKHPVTVRVNVTEPVTYRSYTWCLRVPPRCSKYTVQLQDRVKIHTAMHNKTITVCCKGYVEMDYKCVPACPPMTDCPFMHCNRTNHCYCTPGYTGLYCNDPCSRGFWGEHCMKECDCPSGYTCHHLTGDCMLDDRPPSKIRRTTTSAMPETTENPETTTTKKSTVMTYPTTPPTTVPTTQSTTTLPTTTTTATIPTTTTTIPTNTTTIRTTTTTIPTATTTIPTTTTTIPTTTTTRITTEKPTTTSTTQDMTTTRLPTTSETVLTVSDITYTTNTPKTTEAASTMKATQMTEPPIITEPTSTTSTERTSTTTIERTSTTTTELTSTTTEPATATSEYKSTIEVIKKEEPTTVGSWTKAETTRMAERLPTWVRSATTTTTTQATTPLRTEETFATARNTEKITSTALETTTTTITAPTTTTTTTPTTTTTTTTTTEPIQTETTKSELTTKSTTMEIPRFFTIASTTVERINATEPIPITHEKSPYEKLPPLMVNRKKTTTQMPEMAYTESTTSSSEIVRPTVVSTTRQTTEDNSIKIFAPIVPFPHHPRNKQDKEVTTEVMVNTTEERKLVPSTLTHQEFTKSPLDFLQPRRPQKPFESNSDNSISANPSRDSTTQKSLDVPFIDTNRRLWEIFETGLNLKSTPESITTTTAEPNFVNFDQSGEIDRPIKKSEIHEETTIKTTLPVLEYEKETSAETSQKQPKHKEKYQKKHKSKIHDATTSQETYTTEYKYKINKYSKTTESSVQEIQETSERLPTSSRPSHTWYSHAREKAKIKEAMKSFKTTPQPDKSTEAFDSDSNDINLMQTSFTEDSKNFQEDFKEQYLMANSFNLTGTRYSPSKITAEKSFYSDFIIIGASCIMMLSILITLIWLRNNKKKRAELSPGSSIVAYESQTETVSPLIYETVFPLNGGPELMEATTFFCPTFTNHYAERINRELSESSYDYPRPRRYNES